MLDLATLAEEVMGYVSDISEAMDQEGAHIYTNYQKVVAYSLRLTEIRNQIALLEITGNADNELRRFRTMIIDPTIEEFKKIQSYESRKITAMQLEYNLAEKGT